MMLHLSKVDGIATMLVGTITMELVLFISLALASNYTTAHLQEANAEDSHADASSSSRITQTSKKRQFGKKKRPRKSQRLMQESNAPKEPEPTPILDSPNRQEIPPGDIPPNQPRNPDVDDRTKIPGNIDPGDKVPPSSIPKPKKPYPPKELR